MAIITATLNGSAMPTIQRDFLNTPKENATDIQTLDGNLYTDFVSVEHSWTFNYRSLTQDQYNVLRAIYDSQFTLFEYPLLSIPFYSLEDAPVRMYINEKNIWSNCGDVQNVQFIFRITDQLDNGSS
jgi:hypothetical protein